MSISEPFAGHKELVIIERVADGTLLAEFGPINLCDRMVLIRNFKLVENTS